MDLANVVPLALLLLCLLSCPAPSASAGPGGVNNAGGGDLSGSKCQAAFSNCATCTGGFKACQTCESGFCLAADGKSCLSTQTNINNCGTCGTKCTPAVQNGAPSCTSGNCGFTCNLGYTPCNNNCKKTTDFRTDAQNCGECGNACPAGPANSVPVCNGGACDFSCTPGYTKCGSGCVVTANDASNCGSCGRVCQTADPNGYPTCSAGRCGVTCNSEGYTKCNGVCKALQSDVNNCGECGVICSNGPANSNLVCTLGACDFSCKSGFVRCGDACVNAATPDAPCPPACQTPFVSNQAAMGGVTLFTCPGFDGVFCSPTNQNPAFVGTSCNGQATYCDAARVSSVGLVESDVNNRYPGCTSSSPGCPDGQFCNGIFPNSGYGVCSDYVPQACAPS